MKISATNLENLAAAVSLMAYNSVVGSSDVDKVTAVNVTVAAGEEFARALGMALRDRGVSIVLDGLSETETDRYDRFYICAGLRQRFGIVNRASGNRTPQEFDTIEAARDQKDKLMSQASRV